MSINFNSFKDADEIRSMRRKSDNIEFMTSSETDEIIEELLQKYRKGLKESVRRS